MISDIVINTQLENLANCPNNFDGEGSKAPSRIALALAGFSLGTSWSNENLLSVTAMPFYGGVEIEYTYENEDVFITIPENAEDGADIQVSRFPRESL